MDNHERALKGAQERWNPSIPRATHSGILNIGGKEFACDVLQDGRRVLRQNTISKALGRGRSAGTDMKRAIELKIPVFVCANNLTSYLEPIISERGQQIFYKGKDGRKLIGYEANILPEVCKIYVKALNDGILQKHQLAIAKSCQIMLYGLASVGITALIDECTKYQEFREKNELQTLISKYISEELREWTKKFPDEFFKQAYRIHNWDYPKEKNHPQYLGKFITKYVYDKLPKGIRDELERKNPMNENGCRKYRHHQFLSEDIGDDNLKKQLVQTITVMKLSENVNQFKELMERL